MDKLDTILKALKVICKENNVTPENDMLLDCAVRIYITEKINKARNGATIPLDTGATEKQKTAMTNMKLAFNDTTTKEEAKKIISDKINSFTQ